MKKIKIIMCLVTLLTCSGYVPPGESPFYYQIGGGDSFPLPATSSIHTIPLRLGARGSLNYNCGSLNPKQSITNTMNNLRDSVHYVVGDMVNNAKAAIGNFPMYMLQRADPGLYDMLNKHVIGAFDQFKVSSRSCSEMEALTAQGKNPYQDWATFSTRSGWQHKIGANPEAADANRINNDVKKSQGNQGIEWIGGTSKGGVGQAPIKVIEDTAIAGFNSILGRGESELGTVAQRFSNEQIVKHWVKPSECAKWIVSVVGDQNIKTTMGKASNSSQPGFGLLPEHDKYTKAVVGNLTRLVRNHVVPSTERLEEVSAPGVEVTLDVIQALQEKDTRMQAMLVRKIARDVSMAICIEKAYLAKRVLNAGSNVPNIRKIEPAQIEIKRAIKQIDSEISDLVTMVRLKKETVSSTLNHLLENRNQEQARAVSLAGESLSDGVHSLENGAIVNKKD